jgi:hypothetical protein
MTDKRLRMPPELLQVNMNWLFLGQNCRNTLYFVTLDDGDAPVAISGANARDICIALQTTYETNMMPLTAHDAQLESFDFVYESSGPGGPLEGGTFVGSGMPSSGLETHDGCASNVTLAMKLSTAFLGRSNHGRIYMVGVNNGLYDVDNPNVLKPGAVTDINGALDAMVTDLKAITLTTPAASGKLVVASFYGHGSLRPTATYNLVESWGLHDTVFDSQRRRLPGRGQ